MARRVAERTHRGFNTQAHPSAATPTTCSICGETPAVAKGEKQHQVLAAHIEQHRPETPCTREHRSDANATWRLDFDAVLHQQARLFFCSECRFFAPVD